jgi:hypothetical protein
MQVAGNLDVYSWNASCNNTDAWKLCSNQSTLQTTPTGTYVNKKQRFKAS